MALGTLDALGAMDADRWAYRRLMNRQQAGPAPSYGRTTPPGIPGPPPGMPTGQAPQTSPVMPPSYASGRREKEDGYADHGGGAAPPTNTPPPADPATLDRWGRAPGHPDFGKPPLGGGHNSDPTRDPGPWVDGYRSHPSATAPQPGYTYAGGPLDFFGTGDIDNVGHITRGNVGATAGFTEDGLSGNTGVRGSNTIKNVNGRFFSNLPAKPSSIPILLANPEFRAIFPNAKQVGFDKIDYGDGRPVDVLEAADPATDSAKAWAWMPENVSVPATAGKGYQDWKAQQPPPPPPGTPPGTPPAPPGGSDTGINEDAYRLLASRGRASRLSDLV